MENKKVCLHQKNGKHIVGLKENAGPSRGGMNLPTKGIRPTDEDNRGTKSLLRI
jgi:hypothetical protein